MVIVKWCVGMDKVGRDKSHMSMGLVKLCCVNSSFKWWRNNGVLKDVDLSSNPPFSAVTTIKSWP